MNQDVRMRGFASRTPVEKAARWVDSLELNPGSETIPLAAAAGRVLATNIISSVDVPGFRQAMMDGFAIIADDVLGADTYNPIELKVVGQVLPGQKCEIDIQGRQAVQVMTGAEVPSSCNAVIPVEFTQQSQDESVVQIRTSIAEQKNVGQIGEDIEAGARVLGHGRKLRPQDVAILSAIGIPKIDVVRPPQVRIIVTGNELLAAGKKPRGVQIVDSNSVMLQALIQRDGGTGEFPGILPDDPDRIRAALQQPADVILIAGGSSTGKEDHAPILVSELGDLAIHGIAMRPSSPAGMGLIGHTPVLLLPGNPVSCLCAYDFFARPIIRRLSGLNPDWPYDRVQLPLRQKISSAIGRTDYARVRIVDHQVEPIAISGASILSSTIQADGFCIISEDSEGLAAGAEIEVFLY